MSQNYYTISANYEECGDITPARLLVFEGNKRTSIPKFISTPTRIEMNGGLGRSAKLSDFIFPGTNRRYEWMFSQKVLNILLEYNLPKYKTLELEVKKGTGRKMYTYFLLQETIYKYIIPDSVILKRLSRKTKTWEPVFKADSTYLENILLKSLGDDGRMTRIARMGLTDGFDLDFFTLSAFVDGAIISSRLKDAFQAAGLTGLSYDPVDFQIDIGALPDTTSKWIKDHNAQYHLGASSTPVKNTSQRYYAIDVNLDDSTDGRPSSFSLWPLKGKRAMNPSPRYDSLPTRVILEEGFSPEIEILNDFLFPSSMSGSFQLIFSEKVHAILQGHNLPEHLLLPMETERGLGEIDYTGAYTDLYTYFLFTETIYNHLIQGTTKVKRLNSKTRYWSEPFIADNTYLENVLVKGIFPGYDRKENDSYTEVTSIELTNNFDLDLFNLGFLWKEPIISARLKDAFEAAGVTGLKYEPVDFITVRE